MKKNLCVVLCIFGLSISIFAGTYSGGSGTEADPYQISTLSDLSELCQTSADWNKYFILTNDINATQTQYWDDADDNTDGDLYNDPNDSNANGDNDGWPSIGDNLGGFEGEFDGDGYEISHLTSNRPEENYHGLFGYVREAIIQNLGVVSVDFNGKSYMGGLAGSATRTQVIYCYTSGNIESTSTYIGGLIGTTYGASSPPDGEIISCYSSCNVFSESSYIGGLVGENHHSLVSKSYSTGSVYSESMSTWENCVGGLVGNNNEGVIDQCYSSSIVTASCFAGGLVGYNQIHAWIKNSYATGEVHQREGSPFREEFGGLCGMNFNSYIVNCFSNADVYWDYPGSDDPTDKGFIGYETGTDSYFADNFFDADASNQSTDGEYKSTTKSAAEMKNLSTFTDEVTVGLDNAWDFVGTVNDDTESNDYWDIDNGTSRPYLSWEHRDMTWLGNNSNWDNTNNWEGSLELPTSDKNVIIPNTANDPVLQSGDQADCNDLNIQAGGVLTIESGGSLITNGSITNNGTFLMQHSGSSDYWHYVSSPVHGATASVFAGDFLQYYTESAAPGNHYTEIANGATLLNVCQGYAWRSATKGSFTFNGTPYTGNQQYTGMTTSDDYGWNLLGNPYPSSLDWNMLDDTYGAVYTYVQNSDTEGDYVWRSYNNGGTNGGVRYVSPMQGFFIAADGKTSFTVTNSVRTHSGADGFVKSENNLDNYVLLQINDGSISDEILIQIGNEYKEGFELVNDAWQMGDELNDRLLIYSKCQDGSLSIDRRPETSSIQMGVKNPENSILNISKSESSGLENLILEDTKLNKLHDLTQGAYSFNWHTTDSEERFVLHLKATGTEEIEAQEAQVYASNGQVYVRLKEQTEFNQMVIYDLAGRLVVNYNLNNQSLQRFDTDYLTGVYLVQLRGMNRIITKKINLN